MEEKELFNFKDVEDFFDEKALEKHGRKHKK